MYFTSKLALYYILFMVECLDKYLFENMQTVNVRLEFLKTI